MVESGNSCSTMFAGDLREPLHRGEASASSLSSASAPEAGRSLSSSSFPLGELRRVVLAVNVMMLISQLVSFAAVLLARREDGSWSTYDATSMNGSLVNFHVHVTASLVTMGFYITGILGALQLDLSLISAALVFYVAVFLLAVLELDCGGIMLSVCLIYPHSLLVREVQQQRQALHQMQAAFFEPSTTKDGVLIAFVV